MAIFHLQFPQGVYIRNGPNPMFGGLKSTKSIFGESSPLWIEGEGLLHALYFSKNINGNWTVVYNNRHVETDTFKLEKLRNKPSFLPVIQGDPLAVCTSFLLNLVRFGKPLKNTSNTNVFEHLGKLYSITENDFPQEIDILTLEALGDWDVYGAWNRPFTAHPKVLGKLVTMGIAATKPFVEVGVISGIIHKLDLKLDRCPLCHEIGVTNRYIVFMDCPLTVVVNRFIRGGQLIKYESEGNARIGIMPRHGDADSIQWFKVKPNCTFHIINCFEDGDEAWGDLEALPRSTLKRKIMKKSNTYCSGAAFVGIAATKPFVEVGVISSNTYCSGAAFVPKKGGVEEDDGWIITFVHHEDTSISEAYIIDSKNFLNEPVTKITLPFRVPYGFHGAFMPIQLQNTDSSNLMKLP
ncbi:hypothetical protein GOBAR_AA29714 [Gossypium barbadense]|uniref:Uncharacterized protein n=1 Tax=Gossypium barbadense TaxID=3634 RepID=A0A2P5WIR3_GOSBA|nr:hypothetical protein GOBAR_AA29714 [Gossypium barbadense]